ncbi:hypothetical protein K458DRAFT_433665 [Lentithecium fluviatile CBS 122367]|uniref:Uncharacterized protein n=1 Tax=Lentithecium fluviatile CBS 122367 TaxID=1168545 RepID=A0A6G1IUG0_9PLEO|nr:hypothetical protein K458DRAFT_433665 [Lentithecium fluviatile CBS 122367]
MLPFDTPEPTTYAALLDILRDEALPFDTAPDDLDRIDYAVSRIAHLRANYATFLKCHICGNQAPQVMHMRHMINEIESLGVRGWVKSLEERRMYGSYEEMEQALDVSSQEVEVLKKEKRELLDDVGQLECAFERLPLEERADAARLRRQVDLLLQEEGMLNYQQEYVQKLEALVERLERLANPKEIGAEGLEQYRTSGRGNIKRDMTLSDNESETYGRQISNEHAERKPERPRRRPRPFSESSVLVEVGSSGPRSPTASAVGTNLSSDLEYPPPLRRSAEDEKEDDDQNAKRLEEENTSWSQEAEERQHIQPTSEEQLPSSPSSVDFVPSYIYIPLPANFTLPQHNASLPSLTFQTPPSVFHFPQGAKKDQLLSVLRQRSASGLPMPHFEPLGSINVMQVRTHHMEWELKNAIRKIMTREQWDIKVGNQWYTEGQGDTYIVSKTDVYFHGVSPTTSGWSGNNQGVDRPSDNENPRLRGGASSYSLEDRERRSFAALSGGTWQFRIPDDYREVLDDIDEAKERGFQKAYIEYARIIQLQNASQDRMIEHLQDIIKDMEDTFDWQDNELDTLHHRADHWKQEVMTAREDAAKAWKKVDAAREETEELKALMNEINEQVGGFYEQLEQELEGMSVYAEPEEWDGPTTPHIRGGGDSADHAPSSPSLKRTPKCGEPSNQDIEATAFYFFPSVSIMVLLSNPLRYFQWPRRTTLAKAFEILQHRHSTGTETNAHLIHIREIMEIREEMGIPLLDTSNGRQVLVALPKIEEELMNKKAEEDSEWEKSFGEYDYERMLRDQMRGVEIPASGDWSHLSPSSSSESFQDAGYLLNLINDQAVTPSGSCNTCGTNKRTSRSTVNTGMQNPYTEPTVNFRGGGNNDSRLPPLTMPSSILFPPIIKKRPAFLRKKTKPIVPERSSQPHLARMPEDKMWNVVRYPHEENSEELYEECELDRSANYDFELGIGGQSPSKHPKHDDNDEKMGDVDDAECEMWRHHKGEGCESWLNRSMLDPHRTTCTFCHLPWAEDPFKEWEFAEDRRPGEGNAGTPVDTSRRKAPVKIAHIVPSRCPTDPDTTLRSGDDTDETGFPSRGNAPPPNSPHAPSIQCPSLRAKRTNPSSESRANKDACRNKPQSMYRLSNVPQHHLPHTTQTSPSHTSLSAEHSALVVEIALLRAQLRDADAKIQFLQFVEQEEKNCSQQSTSMFQVRRPHPRHGSRVQGSGRGIGEEQHERRTWSGDKDEAGQPWVPETVAESSCGRRIMVERKEVGEEYDGMILGAY